MPHPWIWPSTPRNIITRHDSHHDHHHPLRSTASTPDRVKKRKRRKKRKKNCKVNTTFPGAPESYKNDYKQTGGDICLKTTSAFGARAGSLTRLSRGKLLWSRSQQPSWKGNSISNPPRSALCKPAPPSTNTPPYSARGRFFFTIFWGKTKKKDSKKIKSNRLL